MSDDSGKKTEDSTRQIKGDVLRSLRESAQHQQLPSSLSTHASEEGQEPTRSIDRDNLRSLIDAQVEDAIQAVQPERPDEVTRERPNLSDAMSAELGDGPRFEDLPTPTRRPTTGGLDLSDLPRPALSPSALGGRTSRPKDSTKKLSRDEIQAIAAQSAEIDSEPLEPPDDLLGLDLPLRNTSSAPEHDDLPAPKGAVSTSSAPEHDDLPAPKSAASASSAPEHDDLPAPKGAAPAFDDLPAPKGAAAAAFDDLPAPIDASPATSEAPEALDLGDPDEDLVGALGALADEISSASAPSASSEPDPAASLDVDRLVSEASEPAAEVAPEPAAEVTPEPAAEPVVEATPEPAAEVAPEPAKPAPTPEAPRPARVDAAPDDAAQDDAQDDALEPSGTSNVKLGVLICSILLLIVVIALKVTGIWT